MEVQLNDKFDFNSMPLAPPGTCGIVYKKPTVHPSWGAHGTNAWYVGPACNHYRHCTVFTPTTKQEHISDMVEFFTINPLVQH
eukprot:3581744-Ditylum_brightwellii.AAC.1